MELFLFEISRRDRIGIHLKMMLPTAAAATISYACASATRSITRRADTDRVACRSAKPQVRRQGAAARAKRIEAGMEREPVFFITAAR